MAEEKTRKELLEEPDPFMAFIDKARDFIKKYQQYIVTITLAVFILAVVVSGWIYFKRQAENKASFMLGNALASLNAITQTNSLQKTPSVAEYESVRKKFKEIIDAFGSTGAGKAALLNYADLSYLTKNYDEAIKTYQKALEVFGDQPEFKNLILNGLAYSYEGKKDMDNAIKYFNMIASDDNAIMKDQALYNLGRIYAELGKKDKEIEAYKQIVKKYPDSMYFQLAKEKIAG